MNRQTIKNLIVPMLNNEWISNIATMILGYGVPIFMLHRTYPDNTPGKSRTQSYLRHCLAYLKSHNYQFVSVSDVIQSIVNDVALPKKSIAFTVDDGFFDQAELAAPVFIEFNCPVTIFLVPDFLDGKIWPWFSQIQYAIESTAVATINICIGSEEFVLPLSGAKEKQNALHIIVESVKRVDWSNLDDTIKHLAYATKTTIPKQPPEKFKPMTWVAAQKLEEKGISFGPHSMTHPILSRVSDAQSQYEILESWQQLKQNLAKPTPVFCYPNGDKPDYGRREIDVIKNSELIGAVSTMPEQFKYDSKPTDVVYNLPRYSLPNNFSDFVMYCSWIEFAKEKYRK